MNHKVHLLVFFLKYAHLIVRIFWYSIGTDNLSHFLDLLKVFLFLLLHNESLRGKERPEVGPKTATTFMSTMVV